MTENQEYIYNSLVSQVRMGFSSTEDIIENVLEEIMMNEFGDEIKEAWVRSAIEQEFDQLQKESEHWKSPTDTDRLVKAFRELCGMNIIALHNAGYTTSDGEAEVVAVEDELRKRDIQSDGYCFYHEQDLQRAMSSEGAGLWIAFQKIDNSDDAVTLAVGQKVVDNLRANGFDVNWAGLVNQKIEIQNFKWQKVYSESGENLLNYRNVVNWMTR